MLQAFRRTGIGAAALALCCAVASATTNSDHVWLDASGKPLPFQSQAEILEFLRSGEIVSQEAVGFGTAESDKLLIEQDGVSAHAVFRRVNVTRRNLKMGGRTIPLFKDNCLYEVAAYHLSRRLGLNSVPPTVARRVKGTRGSVQMWVEDALMEKDRAEQGIETPPPGLRMAMWQSMYLFDSLIFNDDRNQGNILYDPDGHLWMIDHTRAFRHFKQPRRLELIRHCKRRVWTALQQLDREELEEELDDVLTGRELQGLLERRDRLVKHIQGLIDKWGEDVVITDE